MKAMYKPVEFDFGYGGAPEVCFLYNHCLRLYKYAF